MITTKRIAWGVFWTTVAVLASIYFMTLPPKIPQDEALAHADSIITMVEDGIDSSTILRGVTIVEGERSTITCEGPTRGNQYFVSVFYELESENHGAEEMFREVDTILERVETIEVVEPSNFEDEIAKVIDENHTQGGLIDYTSNGNLDLSIRVGAHQVDGPVWITIRSACLRR
ncbi:hypothetical protein [Natronoglycomyces albus]|uniref:Uncharacterized protein n=1 Tax=Natronoglycomyces albus TaxID=2811108 RepID=A0A895XKB5_9ACTN|nr:hypothetical protein [Natronoglycomyces albus]QSB05487.1 hypothetical protein JQS30_00640 [Natronoglycomyces albus]